MRDQVLAAIQQAGDGREDLGSGEESRSNLYLRQYLLVVQHVFDGELRRHPAAGLSRGRAQDSRLLEQPARSSPQAPEADGPVPALQVLGAVHVDRFNPLDRRSGDSTRSDGEPDAYTG